MAEECIHGFPLELCAICSPKPVAEVTKPAPRPRSAVQTAVRPAARVAGTATSPVSTLEQRVYHVTHLRNLAAIANEYALVAGATPDFDLSTPELRDERSAVVVTVGPDSMLSDYVPFFLSPDAALWQSLRAGHPHPRLSPAARGVDASEFVILVSSIRQLVAASAHYVVTDGSAEGTLTRFATTREDADRMLRRLRADSTGDALLEAEVLVADRVPLDAVTLVGVGNEKVRAQVREALEGSGFTPKISVYPPWFLAAE